jgi:hypothetical protein
MLLPLQQIQQNGFTAEAQSAQRVFLVVWPSAETPENKTTLRATVIYNQPSVKPSSLLPPDGHMKSDIAKPQASFFLLPASQRQ